MPSVEMLVQQDFGEFGEFIHQHAQDRPQHFAFAHEARTLTYSELDALMDRVVPGSEAVSTTREPRSSMSFASRLGLGNAIPQATAIRACFDSPWEWC